MSNFLGSVHRSGDFSVVSNRIARSGTLSIPSEYTFRTVICAIVVEKHWAASALMETLNDRHTEMPNSIKLLCNRWEHWYGAGVKNREWGIDKQEQRHLWRILRRRSDTRCLACSYTWTMRSAVEPDSLLIGLPLCQNKETPQTALFRKIRRGDNFSVIPSWIFLKTSNILAKFVAQLRKWLKF